VKAIAVKLDDLLDRRMTRRARGRVGMTLANLSILKTGKARAIRFSTLDAICEALSCQPGDILRFEPSKQHASDRQRANGAAQTALWWVGRGCQRRCDVDGGFGRRGATP
jgi:putative transcriptional regulator